jgi:hypothetical protein
LGGAVHRVNNGHSIVVSALKIRLETGLKL